MSKKLETLVSMVLDKSGSMSSIREATIKGVNEYIATLKKDKKASFKFSLTLFDTEYQKPYIDEPLAKVKELDDKSYIPDGWTALYDAACSTIKDLEARVKKDQKVLLVIMTDGMENSSKEYTQKNLKDAIERLTKSGNWSFVFLGANQDSYATAQKFSIPTSNTANFNATDRGVSTAFRVTAQASLNYASGGGSTNFYSKKDQDDLENTV